MAIKPVVIPASPGATYDLVRVAAISITQESVGAPLVIHHQLEYYDSAGQNAPKGTGVGDSITLAYATVAANPDMAQAVTILNQYAIQFSMQSGALPTV